MIKIEINKLRQRSKRYLSSLSGFDFDSLYELLYELFDNYRPDQSEICQIEALLNEIGFYNLKEIQDSKKTEIKEIITSKTTEWEREADAEYLSYKLLAAIQSKAVIVIIDEQVIENLEKPISLHSNSIISFIDNSKTDQITFTTL